MNNNNTPSAAINVFSENMLIIVIVTRLNPVAMALIYDEITSVAYFVLPLPDE